MPQTWRIWIKERHVEVLVSAALAFTCVQPWYGRRPRLRVHRSLLVTQDRLGMHNVLGDLRGSSDILVSLLLYSEVYAHGSAAHPANSGE